MAVSHAITGELPTVHWSATEYDFDSAENYSTTTFRSTLNRVEVSAKEYDLNA